jgi:Xaa-Pro aminopeptidase
LYYDNVWGFQIDNTAVVTDTAPEMLTHSPTFLSEIILCQVCG